MEEIGEGPDVISPLVTLWRDLRSLLQARGELPLEYEVLTPAEIAESVRLTSGDARAHRFVWNYYYPRHFGQAAVDDDAAAALVSSFQAHLEPQEPVEPSPASPRAPSCALCGRQPVRGDSR